MKKIFLFLITSLLPLFSFAESKGDWEWADDVWTRARQDLSPELGIGKFHSSDNPGEFVIMLKMRNPFVSIRMPEANPRMLIKLGDGSVMELKGTPSDYKYVKPTIATSSSTRNRIYAPDAATEIYNRNTKTSLQILDADYLLYATARFAVSDEDAARMTAQPIVKWRVELAGGKHIDYDISDEDAATVQKELKQAFDKVR